MTEGLRVSMRNKSKLLVKKTQKTNRTEQRKDTRYT